MFNFQLLKLFIGDKQTIRILIGVAVSFAFSMTVVLSTIGIMEGYEKTLKLALRKVEGDIIITSSEGYFRLSDEEKKALKGQSIRKFAEFIQTEAFFLAMDHSKSIIVLGVDENFSEIIGLDIFPKEREIFIGKELFNEFQIKKNDQVTLAFGNGHSQVASLPRLEPFLVKDSVDLGLFEKNSRMVLINKNVLDQILDLDGSVNIVSMIMDKMGSENELSLEIDQINKKVSAISNFFSSRIIVRPYWAQYEHLLSAIKHEKATILIVLQVIVLVAIFNILAFIIFLDDRKAKEIFLFMAFGSSKSQIMKLWNTLLIVIYVLSIFLSLVFVYLFKILLKTFIVLPREIYRIEELQLSLTTKDYLIVFIISFVWLFIISWAIKYKNSNRSILHGLRKEFA